MPKKRTYASTLIANRRRVARYRAEGLCVTCGLSRGEAKTVRCKICRRKEDSCRQQRLAAA